MAFLDAMTCGFGALVLFFMVISALAGKRADDLSADLRAEADRLAQVVLEGNLKLVELRNSVDQVDDERVTAQGLSRRMLEMLREIEVELATFDEQTLARRENVRQLQSDLKTLEEEAKRLSASIPSNETPGDRLRSFVGDGDRQYVTGLKVGGRRILVLVDKSASMLDRRLVNILRRRNMDDDSKRNAPKWQKAVAAVDWVTTQIPRSSKFQIYSFDETSRALVDGSEGQWLDGGSADDLNKAVAALKGAVPGGGTNLARALASVGQLSPRPDNIILLVDGLPTQGLKGSNRNKVTGRQRARLFRDAVAGLETNIPVNVLLFPMEGDPEAASLYWRLAIRTGGAFLTPTRDWP